MVCVFIAIYFAIKHIILYVISTDNYTENNIINVCIDIVGLPSTLALIFILINKYFLKKWFLGILGLPKIKGNFEGNLISSYHIDDNPNKPHIDKYVKMSISQNLNGYLVEAFFYSSKNSKEVTSESESITHEILSKGNGKFTISYLYRNSAYAFNKDHKKYNLNNHEGIAVLTYDPSELSLVGKYFNDSQERPSYGRLTLKKV